jgi:hypothetical protein
MLDVINSAPPRAAAGGRPAPFDGESRQTVKVASADAVNTMNRPGDPELRPEA